MLLVIVGGTLYDFSRCKLCRESAVEPAYRLRTTVVLRCMSCDFHFINHLDTMPGSQGDDASFPIDEAAWNFIEANLPHNAKRHRQNVDHLKRYVQPAGSRCLDIGAGAGVFLRFMADEGSSIHGIEPQQVFRAYARKKFNMILSRETVDDPAWQTGDHQSFDLVTLWDVLEHVNFPGETVRGAANVTRPGGVMILDTPARDSLSYRICEWSYRASGGRNTALLETLYSPRPFRHKQIFTIRQLVGLVEGAGLDVIAVQRSFLNLRSRVVLVARKRAQT